MSINSNSMNSRARLIKENNIPLLPNDWDVRRFRFLFRESKERNGNEPVGDMLSVSEYHGVIPKKYRHQEHQRTKEELQDYRVVCPGQLAVNTMWLNHLSLGLSRYLGHVSPAYAVYNISSELDKRFIHYLLRSQFYLKIYLQYLYGIRPNSFQIKTDDWNSIPVIVPPKKEQKSIADFLDQETSRIDKLIEKKDKILSLMSSRIEALVDKVILDKNVPRIRFKNVVHRIQRLVVPSDHNEIVRLGLYNRGRGIFKKPASNEDEIGDSNFFYVKAGDLIISGQFAWEGAVAIATQEEEGCVVSHRYPVYRGRDGVSTGYLLGFLRSKLGDFILNEVSRGSAGRNRPLNTWHLGKEKIPIPSIELQKEISQTIDYEYRLREKIKKSIELLKEFRASLITEAVTGRLNIQKRVIK